MLKKLVDAINVSYLNQHNDALKLIEYLYPKTHIANIKNLLQKPSLQDFGLNIGTDKNKINLLRNELHKQSLSAYIFSTNDEFISEYTPLFAKRLWYITGFSGSLGYAIVTQNTAMLFVDGRYIDQAKQQVDTNIFKVLPLNYNLIIDYCKKSYKKNLPIAINGKTNSFYFINLLLKKLSFANVECNILNQDLIDNVWFNQPPYPVSLIHIYPILYAGEPTLNKTNKIITYLKKENLDALLVTALDNIAWLLNIRGNDIEYCPFVISTLIIYKDGNIDFFVNKDKLLPNIKEYLTSNNINYYNYSELQSKLTSLNLLNIGINNSSPYFYYSYLEKIAKVKILQHDIINTLKTTKNSVEIANTYIAHHKDGSAFTKLILHINHAIDNNLKLTETDIANKIIELKSKITTYKGNSFSSIVAANNNGAYPHYQTTESSNCYINQDTLLLIDCGGQYLEGTTDATRTLSFKAPNKDFKKHFTLVLKGLIALSNIKFPLNTPCCNLDVLARQHLWKYGLDYAHGTGHGVGHYLSVHEGNIRFNQTCNEFLQAGMILSIEPGFYKIDHYGIRLENLVIVVESKEYPNFLEFDTLTHIPIDRKNIDYTLLTNDELLWLQNYHQKVLSNLKPYLTPKDFLSLQNLIGANVFL